MRQVPGAAPVAPVAALDIARGMRYLHSTGVIHRDLKPENIGFVEDGTAKTFDFGLTKKVDPVSGLRFDGHKHTGLVGTFRYMPPKVAAAKNYDPSVKVYSFELVLCEICNLDAPPAGLGSAAEEATPDDLQAMQPEPRRRPRSRPLCTPL